MALRGESHCGRGRPPRLRHEREARAVIDPATAVDESRDDDLGTLLHAEIDRLPEKYRAPIVLCYLQGQTIDEASRQLGWPAGTVGGRLARARDRLRNWLARQGLAAPAVLATALVPEPSTAVAVSPALARVTGNAALQLAAGRPASAVVSAVMANLLEQTMRAMTWTRLTIGAGICGLLVALTIGAAGLTLMAGALDNPPSNQPPARTKSPSGPDRPGGNPVVETLNLASQIAADLSDPQEKLDAAHGPCLGPDQERRPVRCASQP